MIYPKILEATAIDNYRLMIKFKTGEIKIFDVKPYIKGTWFSQLKDTNLFNTVKPCFNTVEWCNGQDIAPEDLYELSQPYAT